MSATIIATGFIEVDAALARFEAKVQKKYLRTALNNSVKFVQSAFQRLCPVETGAMRDATKRFTPKGRRRGDIRRGLRIDRDKLFALRTERGGRVGQGVVQIGLAKRGSLGFRVAKLLGVKEDRKFADFFYPAVVELGDQDTPAQKPLRGALYGNEQHVRQEFITQLRLAIATARAK